MNPVLAGRRNKLITFDLWDIRAAYLGGTDADLQFTARFGVNGIVGVENPPNAVLQGGVWVDGVLVDISSELSRTDPSHPFDFLISNSSRWLTLAILNGNNSSAWDDGAFIDANLTVVASAQVPEPSSWLLLTGVALVLGLRFGRRGVRRSKATESLCS